MEHKPGTDGDLPLMIQVDFSFIFLFLIQIHGVYVTRSNTLNKLFGGPVNVFGCFMFADAKPVLILLQLLPYICRIFQPHDTFVFAVLPMLTYLKVVFLLVLMTCQCIPF